MPKWRSRKLFIAIGSVVTVVLCQVGLPEDLAAQITDTIVKIALGFFASQGAADVATALKKA